MKNALKILSSPVTWIGISFVLMLLFVRSCRNESALEDRLKETNEQILRHELNPANELKIELSKKEFQLHLKEGRISQLLDSLEIKPKQVLSYKYITTQRTVHDTLYEYELVEGFDFRKDYDFDLKCVKAKVSFINNHPTLSATINTDFTDINYYQRKNLFGVKKLPKWGKKQYFQTLYSNCGDTIKHNQLIKHTKL